MHQQIRRFLLTTFLFTEDDAALKSGESLLDQGIIDSTGVLELVAFLEQQFGISIADDELLPENLDSVDRIAEFVGRKQAAASTRLGATA